MSQALLPPKIVRAGQGEALWVLGEKTTLKLDPADAQRRFGLVEVIVPPGGGPPPHIHRREDEMFYVIEGTFGFVLDGRTFTRSAGFCAYLPKDILHTFKNIGTTPGKLLVTPVPCGFEDFIRSFAIPVKDPAEAPPAVTPEDIAGLLAATEKFGIEIKPDAVLTTDNRPPAADPIYWLLGMTVTFKLTSQETNGQFSTVVADTPPGAAVPPHLHHAMDEFFYVLEGAYEFHVNGQQVQATAGDFVFVPRGNWHGFANVSTAPARLYNGHYPGGFENFFREAGIPVPDIHATPTPPPFHPEAFLTLIRKHGMDMHVPE